MQKYLKQLAIANAKEHKSRNCYTMHFKMHLEVDDLHKISPPLLPWSPPPKHMNNKNKNNKNNKTIQTHTQSAGTISNTNSFSEKKVRKPEKNSLRKKGEITRVSEQAASSRSTGKSQFANFSSCSSVVTPYAKILYSPLHFSSTAVISYLNWRAVEEEEVRGPLCDLIMVEHSY